uniref:Probable tRNA pseudouridine synthase D n=1 Tax=Candidatus Methanomethylicus mesodigestus TaxID=1867258 RepID=A0A7C3IWK2_9CREN
MHLERTKSVLEESLGMEYYSCHFEGSGGRLRQVPEDFVVEEITPEGVIMGEETRSLDRGEGAYTLALLKKKSRDLIPAINAIAKRLRASVSFAGIKDRRAVTYQLISVHAPAQQKDMPQGIEGISLRVLGRSKYPVEPGDLKGNRFTITIRSIQDGPLPQISDCWLLNYFGHQRFGTARPNTHKIGRLLIKRDYEGAVREFLAEPYPTEPAASRAARESLKSGWDLLKSIREFPPGLAYERHLMARLIRGQLSYEMALKALPATILRLFIDSYQSYLFNRALSLRAEEAISRRIGIGDYVSPMDLWGSPSRPIRCDSSNEERLRRMVSSGKAVVMMRVVGSRGVATTVEGDAYLSIMEEEGISQSDFRSILGMSFEGTLRPTLVRPIDFSSSIMEDDLNHGMRKAAVKFSLPKACYATVVLRELMRPEDPLSAGY